MKWIILLLGMILLADCASAQTLEVDLNKKVFYPNENIIVYTNVTNDYASKLQLDVVCTFFSIENPRYRAIFQETIELSPQETKSLNFSLETPETLPSGEHEVAIHLLQGSSTVSNMSKRFEVKGTKKIIEAHVSSCSDIYCTEERTVFILGETAYLRLFSEVSDIGIMSEIETPSATGNLTFRDGIATIPIIRAGNYRISVMLSKEGYQTATRTLQFAVIEREVKIINASVCDVDGVCSGKENYQNCPQDCPSGGKDEYCDGIEAGVCDPDCREGEDPDCKGEQVKKIQNKTASIEESDDDKQQFPLLWVFVLSIVIVGLFVLVKYHKNKERKIKKILKELGKNK